MIPKQTETPSAWRAADILKRLLGLVAPARREPIPERTEAQQVAFDRRVAKRRARNKVARKSRRTNRLAAQR